MHSQIEIERKYDVAASLTVPPLWDIATVVSAGEVLLDAVYFDTAAGDLSAQRIVLRRRAGGADEGWHVKLPGEEGRTELHWPLEIEASHRVGQVPDAPGVAADRPLVPEQVRDSVRAHVRDHPLDAIATIHTRRTMLHLIDDTDAPILEIADDLVSASDLSTGVLRVWREWEIELLDGAPRSRDERTALLDAVETRLLSAGATPAASVSKLASALGRTRLGSETTDAAETADAAAPAASASRVELTRSSPIGAVLHRAVAALTADVKVFDAAVRRHEHDAVHQLRTRVRRIRSVLSTYGAVFDPEVTGPLGRELREFAAVLGEARDAEVMAERAQALIDDHPQVAGGLSNPLVRSWTDAHAASYDRVLARLSDARYYRLLDSLDALSTTPPSGEAAEVSASTFVPTVLAGRLRGVLATAERADAASDDTRRLELLHDTRKAAKSLRYSAEAVSIGATAVFGRKMRDLGAAAEGVHDLLGEYRDSSMMQDYLRQTAGASEWAFAYGVLYEIERHGAALCLAEYPAALKVLKSFR